jgi:PAS domain S-box-containing protein
LSVNRDITERKRAEETLRKSEEKYRGLTENINLGIYRNTVGPEGKFIEANSAIIGMFGYKSKEEFLAINVSDLYQNSEDRNKFNDKMLKEEFVRSEELWLKKKDGSRFIGSVSAVAVKDEQGYVKYYDGIIEDITERKRTEQDLKKSAQLLMDTGEMAKVGAWELDLSAKEVLMTEEVCRIHGVEPGYKPKLEEAIKFYAPESVPALEATLKKTIETGEPYDLESLFIPRGSKDKIWVRSLGRAVYSAGKIVKLAGTFQNIDKYKRAEAARERLLTELEAQNRELESFVYTVSHDLKAPLVSMSGFSSALKKEYENQLAEKGKHYLERIQANVAQMDSLIANLLELSRIGQVAEPTEGIDVAALLREIRDALAIRLREAGAKLVVQEPLPTVRADRIRIRQVFVNLIDNAVKFKSAERALRIEVGCRQQSGFHRFHVTDNGIGIPHKYQDQIFAPFQKLHSEIEGVGIGLALVKKIVEHHGGRVWLESPSAKFISSEAEGIGTGNEGAGATFYFTLPIESGVKPLS